MSKTKKSDFIFFYILLALGFILIALDIDIKTGIQYPHEYTNTDSVTGEFQYYNISSLYSASCTYKLIDTSNKNTEQPLTNEQITVSQVSSETKVIDKVFFDNIHIDIANDILGFIFILIACIRLGIVNRRFRLGAVSAFCGITLNIILSALPFIIDGLTLCITAMLTGIAYLTCNIFTTFLFTSGLFKMCPQACCRDERKWCKITWFTAFALQVLTTFILWVGSDFSALYTLGQIIELLLVVDIIGFFIILKRTLPYMEKSYINSFNLSVTRS